MQNNKFVKTLIFGKTKEQGIEFLENLIKNVESENIVKVQRSKFEFSVELKDGNLYKVVSASDNARGYRCDKDYVSNEVDIDILNNVIKPLLLPSELPDTDRIIYY